MDISKIKGPRTSYQSVPFPVAKYAQFSFLGIHHLDNFHALIQRGFRVIQKIAVDI